MIMHVLATALLGVQAPTTWQPPSCEQLPSTTTVASTRQSPWNGRFAINRAESDDPDRVAERAAGKLRRRQRARATSALRQRLEPSSCLRLTSDSAGISIESERGVVWRVSRSGTAEPGAARAAGRSLPATITDEAITISGRGDRGDLHYELTRSTDGRRLTLRTRITTERLAEPIAYTLVYDALGDGGTTP
jgi:hypothetical protein